MRDTRVLVEIAILVAMAFVLEVVFLVIPGMPFGGRVGLSLIPIIVLSWRQGIVPGIIGGTVFGLLNMLLDGMGPAAWGITWTVFIGAMFLDYMIAFGVVGLAAISKKFMGDTLYAFVVGTIIAGTLRFLFHFLSGVIFWAAWADEVAIEGMNPVWYSFVYNITYMGPTIILITLVAFGIYKPLRDYAKTEQYTT